MINKVTSIFTFGIFLIIVGAILKVMKWPQAEVLLATGLLFELLALILFAYKKIKK